MTKGLQSSLRNFPSKILKKFLEALMTFLPLEDKKSCRLVNSQWRHVVEKQLRFGILLTDRTVKAVSKNDRLISKNCEFTVYAMDLVEPLSQHDLKFAPKVRSLVFETGFKGEFRSKNGVKKENEKEGLVNSPPTSSSPPPPSSSPSSPATVSTPNFLTLMWNFQNLETLQLNRNALGHAQLQSNAFKGLHLKCTQLKRLRVVVTGSEELERLRTLFAGCTFPRLETLAVAFNNISWAPNFDVYLDVLIFILKHKATIKSIDLTDPPMVPRLKNKVNCNNLQLNKADQAAKVKSPSSMSKLIQGQSQGQGQGQGEGHVGFSHPEKRLKGHSSVKFKLRRAKTAQSLTTPTTTLLEEGEKGVEEEDNWKTLPQTYEAYLTLFKEEFNSIKLEELAIYFCENKFSSWGLGIKLIESQRCLTSIILECVPACLAEKVAWNNSSTLKKFVVKGIRFLVMPSVSKVFDGASLKMAHSLEELVLKEFFAIKNIQRIPVKRIKSLTLLTYMGNDKLYGTASLCDYETAKWLSENLRVVERLVLFRASMITCALTKKFYKLPCLNEVTFVGFQGQAGCFEVQKEGGMMVPLKQGYLESLCLLLDSDMTPAQMIGEMSLPFASADHAHTHTHVHGHPAGKSFIKENKMCSEASLCRSCIKILTPKVTRDSPMDRLSRKVRSKIFAHLPLSDLSSCRLVRRSWSREVQKFLDFGFCLTDTTCAFIAETAIKDISFVAVSNSKFYSLDRSYFARNIKTLVLEFNEDLFKKMNNNNKEGHLNSRSLTDLIQEVNDFELFPEKHQPSIERAFGVGRESSIKARNILKLLESTVNLETLFVNQWALSNLFGPNRLGIKNKIFTKLAYRNLKNLHLVVHSCEADALAQFLNLEFNAKVIVLEKLSIQIVGTPRSRSFEAHESIFKFLASQESLSEFKLENPIVPDSYKGHQVSDLEPWSVTSSVLAFAHLTKLTIIFKENPNAKWNWGFIFLRAQKYLKDIWLEGLPVNEVHTVILNNTGSLNSIVFVAGCVQAKKKTPFNLAYTKNCSKLTRLIVKNTDVENTQDLPNSIKILEINIPFLKNSTPWNLTPTLNRVRSKVSISAKNSKTFMKRFGNLEKIALVHLGAVGKEVMTLFLQLPHLQEILVSEVHPELETLLIQSNFNSNSTTTNFLSELGAVNGSVIENGSDRLVSIEPAILGYQVMLGNPSNGANNNNNGGGGGGSGNNSTNNGRNNFKQGFITVGVRFLLRPSSHPPFSIEQATATPSL